MTSKLTIAKPGGGVTDLTGFSPSLRKGAAFFDHNDPLIQIGHRCANGEASQGTFKLMDPDAQIPAVDYSYGIQAHKLVTWTEDASGDEIWLSRGRTSLYDGGRGKTMVDDEVEYDVTVDDGNVELRGQAFTEAWERPEETDVARVLALQAYTLNGASSTAPHFRESCEVTAETDHLVVNANTVNMPAKTYPVGTQPQDVIQDCADTASKLYAVVIHHEGGSHLCLLYMLENNYDYLSPVKISDHVADWDPDDLTAPVFEPHWEQGKASLYDGQQLLSGLISSYGADAAVFVEHAANIDTYDYWVDSYNDSYSVNPTQATLRATGVLEYRRLTHVTHRVSIMMLPEQVHLVAAGMAIEVKAAAMMGGQYLDTWQTRRIAECQWEPISDGRYWAHLNLDRAQKRMGYTPGKSIVPKPATDGLPGFAGTCATGYLGGPSYVLKQASVAGVGDVPCRITDGNDATYTQLAAPVGAAYTWIGADMLTARTFASTRLVQAVAPSGSGIDAGEAATNWVIEVSDDWGGPSDPTTGTWTNVTTVAGATVGDSGVVSFTATTSQFWRIRATAGGAGGWVINTWDLNGPDGGITVGGPGEGSTGPGGTYVPGGTVVEHGDLAGKGGTMHDLSQSSYDNSTSGLTADDGQEAVDELAAGLAAALTNPMTTAADLIVGDTGGTPVRLAKGSDGDVLTVDPTSHLLAWAAPSGGGSGLTIEEVDGAPTIAATKLVFPNGTLTDNGGGEAEYTPAGGGGGGAVAQAYAGYNTIGGSSVAPTNFESVVQKITLANDCQLTDIEVYVKQNSAAQAGAFDVLLYDDVSGKPYHLLRAVRVSAVNSVASGFNLYRVAATAGDARWFGMPVNKWLTAGDWWIGFAWLVQGANHLVYYDAGADWKWTKGGNGFETDAPDTSGTVYTLTDSTRKYSIRANTIR